MAKKHVSIHIHDVWLGGRRGETVVVKVPYPKGLSKKQRALFGDGAADATAKILDAVQPVQPRQKAGFSA
jgi:hypothetical protein